jgi:hypothetical protein
MTLKNLWHGTTILVLPGLRALRHGCGLWLFKTDSAVKSSRHIDSQRIDLIDQC